MNINTISFENMRINNLFEPGNTIVWKYLINLAWPWEAIPLIEEYVITLIDELDASEYDVRQSNVWIHKTAVIAPSAFIGSRVIIGARTEVRHCAFIRGPALVGEGAVIGNSTELKNSILFDGVQVPHFNYIGDSIFGYKSHTGAGVITSNVKSDHTLVTVTSGNVRIKTGIKKFGAILGDFVEVGCNAVLNPGCVVGPNSTIYPLSMVRGFIPAVSIYKKQGEVVGKC